MNSEKCDTAGTDSAQGLAEFERGTSAFQQDNLEKAIIHFDKALALGFAANADVYRRRGSCLATLNYDLDAIDDYSKAIEIEPNDSLLFLSRGIAKGRTGDFQGSVDDLREAIRVASSENNATERCHSELAKEQGCRNSA